MSLLSLASLAQAEVLVYKVDPVHSGLNFKVRHFLNQVPGSFQKFTGEIHYDADNLANCKAFGEIEVGSVDTRNTDRDAHLQKDDFFKATANPKIAFSSTEWKKIGENKYAVTGILTMAGVGKSITFELEYLGEMPGRGGAMVSGWQGTGTIKRSDWGIAGGAGVVGDDVVLDLSIQAKR